MTLKLTEREIIAAQTKKGGYSREQLQKWGVPWPPPKGWKKALLQGRSIGEEAKKEYQSHCAWATLVSTKKVMVRPTTLAGYREEYVEPYGCTRRTYQII